MAWQTGDVVGPTNLNNKLLATSKVVSAANYPRGTSGVTADDNATAVNAAVAAAPGLGATAVFVDASLLPYNASLVTFNTAVRMVREGGNPTVYDVAAYGASHATVSTAAIQAAVNAVPATGGTVAVEDMVPLVDNTILLPTDRLVVLRGNGGHITAGVYQGSGYKRAATFTTGPLFAQRGGTSPTYGAHVRDLFFDGAGLVGDLLELNQTNQSRLYHVGFSHSQGNGLYAPGLWNAVIAHCSWIGVGNAGGTTAGLWLDSTATNATNTVLITQPYIEAMTGRAIWMGNAGGGGRCSLVTIIGGKIEQSTNALGLPFIDLHAVADIIIDGLTCSNGLDNASTHIVVTDGQRCRIAADHVCSSAVDGQNPQFFVDVQGTSGGIVVGGRYQRGGGNSGAQIHIAATVSEWRLLPGIIHDSPLHTQVQFGSGTVLFRAAIGNSGYGLVTSALGVGSTISGPLQGVDVNYVANGNTGAILATGQDGQQIVVVNEGATTITWNATDDTSHVLAASSNNIAGGTAARFVWDSRKGTSGLWVHIA